MKKTILFIAALLMTFSASAQTYGEEFEMALDTVCMSKFTAVYDYTIRTTDHTGKELTDSILLALQVGDGYWKCTPYMRVLPLRDHNREHIVDVLNQEALMHVETIVSGYPEGKPANALEAYTMATKRSDNAIEKFNKNSRIIQQQYKSIVDCLCELLGRSNLYPYETPKFKDENGHILLNSLYLYPLYCVKCFYSSRYVRGFFKFVAWSIWLICIGLLLFIARDNAILKKQQNINRYVHAYFSDNAEVMMELEGIDLMFSDQEVMPMPIKNYRECMKERKDEMKNHKGK